jgi:hypothetical protein
MRHREVLRGRLMTPREVGPRAQEGPQGPFREVGLREGPLDRRPDLSALMLPYCRESTLLRRESLQDHADGKYCGSAGIIRVQ